MFTRSKQRNFKKVRYEHTSFPVLFILVYPTSALAQNKSLFSLFLHRTFNITPYIPKANELLRSIRPAVFLF